MDLIVFHIWLLELPLYGLDSVVHIWLLELPHMDLTVYHIWPRTTTYGLDSVSYLASNYHIWTR